MLLDFTVENFGPFDRKVTLSMIASKLTDRPEAVITSEAAKNGILKSVTVFGPNASGKSYLFKAISTLQSVIGKRRTPTQPIWPYNPFAVRRKRSMEPTTFGIRLVEGGIIYDYAISYADDHVQYERLTYYPNNYPVVVFEREFGKKGKNLKDAHMLTNTTAYLLFASEFNDRICNDALKAIMGIRVVSDASVSLRSSLEELNGYPELRPIVLDAMDAADMGITDIDIVMGRCMPEYDDDAFDDRKQVDLRITGIVHEFDDGEGGMSRVKLYLPLESSGSKEMLTVIVPIAECLRDGGTIVIDEFGSKLHHGLTRWILNMFNSDMNRNGAQLLVNTHDLGLMDISEIQRRDQIRFTNRSRETGISELYSLTDFGGVTKRTNVLKEYLDGRYSAVPCTVGRDIL